MKTPTYLCFQPTDFGQHFSREEFCRVIQPFLPFASVRSVVRAHS